MSHDYPRSIMSRSSKMRGSQAADHRDGSPARQNRSQQQAVLTGSVAILWDMENCPVPSEVKADDVAGNIRMALRMHPVIQGAVTFFSAYGDFNHFPRKVREGCQRTGVNLIDVPNGKKDASDKAILVDLFLFALDNAPPCTILLISGDVDFAPALHKLGQRGYTVVLAIPSGVGVSSALCSAGRFVWDWPSVARGGGLVPAKNFPSRSSGGDERMAEIQLRNIVEERMERMAEIMEINASAVERGGSQDDDSDLPSDDPASYDDEMIVFKPPAPPPPRRVDHAVLDGSSSSRLDHAAQQRSSGPSSSMHSASSGKSLSQGMYPPASSRGEQQSSQPSIGRETTAVVRGQAEATGSSGAAAKGSSKSVAAPADNLQALREQLVRLLSLNGNKLEMSRVSAEYQKLYGKPLFPGEHGHSGTKLVNLLERLVERLRESVFMRGDGAARTLHLTKTGSRAAAKLKRDAKQSRGVPREEAEVVDVNLIRVEYPGDVDDETAGEEVIVGSGSGMKGIQSLIADTQSLLHDDKETQKPPSPTKKKSEREHKEELEEIHLPRYDWGFGSGGSRDGSGDEKDNNLQQQKDVEVLESTVEQIVKFKGKNKRAAGLDILDVFRLELQELLVSYACEIPMTGFIKLYEQRYAKVLDYEKFGVSDLESLIERVSDVAVVMEGSYVVAHRIPHDLRISEKTDSTGTPQESES